MKPMRHTPAIRRMSCPRETAAMREFASADKVHGNPWGGKHIK